MKKFLIILLSVISLLITIVYNLLVSSDIPTRISKFEFSTSITLITLTSILWFIIINNNQRKLANLLIFFVIMFILYILLYKFVGSLKYYIYYDTYLKTLDIYSIIWCLILIIYQAKKLIKR